MHVSRLAFASIAGSSLVLAGCAANRVDAERPDPAQRGMVATLRGASVLAACESPDVAYATSARIVSRPPRRFRSAWGLGFGGGSAVGGGVGVSAPVGEGRLATGFSANGRITGVASGRLVWTASAAAAPSTDLDAQLDQRSVALLDSAARSGLF